MILFLPLPRFTFEGTLRSWRGAAVDLRDTMTTQSKCLEGYQLKRGPEQRPAHVDSSSEPGYQLASRGRQKHEDDRLGLLERIFDPLSRRCLRIRCSG